MAEDNSDWQAVIADDLKRVLEIMREAAKDKNPEIKEVLDYSLDSPGKMVRPSLVILSYYACGGKMNEDVLNYAAALELVHMATLIHDDINDQSESRRGKPATYRQFCVRKALTTGDAMLVRAMTLFKNNPKLLQSIIRMGSALTDSEFMQYNHKFDLDILESEYYQVISGKTAAFLSECTRMGATLAGMPDEDEEEIARFGQLYGMAFQIADDLIDLTGSEKISGKTAMRDLSEGVITLPTIIAMRDPAHGSEIRNKIKDGASLDEIRTLIIDTDAIDVCKTVINDYVDEAVDSLDILADSVYKDSLIKVTKLNLTRLS